VNGFLTNGTASVTCPDCEKLAEETQGLRAALAETRARLNGISRGQAKLKQQLSPLFEALKMVFGELQDVEATATISAGAASLVKWQSWKEKLPGRPAEFIDLLLLHNEMTGAQLQAAARCGKDTVYQTIAKLNKAQLLVKNGGKFSLKAL
jgi:hypothetical protein